MIDENKKLEVGGRVKISGVWHEVESSSPTIGKNCCKIGDFFYAVNEIRSIIHAYEPPEEESPYEWISTGMWNPWNPFSSLEAARVLKESLLERYGDPTIRTYAGEDAGKYGLEDDCFVLYYCHDRVSWGRSRFRYLKAGEKWRKQPPSPKGSTV